MIFLFQLFHWTPNFFQAMIKYDELLKMLHWKLATEIKNVSCLIAKNLENILGDYFLNYF